MQDAGLAPFPDCDSERVAQMAGILSAAMMAGELSLTDGPACFRLLRARGLVNLGFDEIDDMTDAKRIAIRMAEDRARRTTGFRGPRR